MSWGYWDFNSIVFFAVAGAVAWIMFDQAQKDMVEKRIHSKLFGLGLTIMSGVQVGVYFLVSVALYFLIVTLIEKLNVLKNK